jgi:prepilin-type N-terminal cleavage/methylation domain-containing protein
MFHGKKRQRNDATPYGNAPVSIPHRFEVQPHRQTPAAPSNAFTLVELLVVIAIIAILAALLLAGLSRSKMQAQSILCLANEKQLQLAWNSYNNDNRGRLAPNVFSDPANAGAGAYGWVFGTDFGSVADPQMVRSIQTGLLYPYIGSRNVYQCPSSDYQPVIGFTTGKGTPVRANYVSARNYSMSGQMNGELGYDNWAIPNVAEADIKHPPPSLAFVFIHPADFSLAPYFTLQVIQLVWDAAPTTVHMSGDNLSFADGHCEHWIWLERNTQKMAQSGAGGEVGPTDKDFARVAGAYSTPLTGRGEY